MGCRGGADHFRGSSRSISSLSVSSDSKNLACRGIAKFAEQKNIRGLLTDQTTSYNDVEFVVARAGYQYGDSLCKRLLTNMTSCKIRDSADRELGKLSVVAKIAGSLWCMQRVFLQERGLNDPQNEEPQCFALF